MKRNKLIIILIIINILSIGIIYNFIKKDYLNNEIIIVKAMTGTEYENNITSLNTAHEEYANYIEESKKKIATAITDMGVPTSDKDTLENMANNIKNIATSKELLVKTQTISESMAANAHKNYTFDFLDNDNVEEIVAIFIGVSSTNNTTCKTLYVPKLWEYQAIQSYAGSYWCKIGDISSNDSMNYRAVNILSIDGTTVQVHKGGAFADGTVTVNISVLCK